MSIFKACDIRGRYGIELDADMTRRIGLSMAAMIAARGGGEICVGGDFRRSTPELKDALIAGLLAGGAAVVDVGQLPTPVAHFAARHLGCAHVAIVTASHNAGVYNGIKLMIAGRPAVPSLMAELEAETSAAAPSAARGVLRSADVLADYENSVLAAATTAAGTPPDALARAGRNNAPMRIVLDTMAGAFTDIAPRVLRAAGADVCVLATGIDPDYARRAPNPAVDANLASLVAEVVRQGADLGVALDGDGDRVVFVDAAGRIARAEQIGAILVRRLFPGATVVYDLKCASVLPKAITSCGGRAVLQKSGHGFIKSSMIDESADLGVEVSGHFFFRALGGGDDGLFAALLLAAMIGAIVLAKEDKSDDPA